MIDYKYQNNFIFNLLGSKASRAFSKTGSVLFYDPRSRSAFRKILQAPKPISKYYFTPNTMQRVEAVDLKNVKPSSLKYLFEKVGEEVGVCLCKKDDLAFAYIIGAIDIQLLIVSGTKRSVNTFDSRGKPDYAGMNKTNVGACIIDYEQDELIALQNNPFTIMDNNEFGSVMESDPDFRKKVYKIKRELGRLPKGLKFPEVTKAQGPEIFHTYQDLEIKSSKMWRAVKMLVFLKTAKVIDQVFIAEEDPVYNPSTKNEKSDGITKIDSFWDHSINVINPFAVRGHFRQQPKKNLKGEWIKELIYIDSFMKSGYHRQAGRLKEAD